MEDPQERALDHKKQKFAKVEILPPNSARFCVGGLIESSCFVCVGLGF
jgi:hypothetical protein